MPPLQNDLNNKLNSKSGVPKSNTTIKFRAHQHNKRLRSREDSKSAWALASPRFTGDTKYHEAMVGGDGRETMTPDRMDQRRRSTGTATRNLKRPQTCFETRPRYTYGHEERRGLTPASEAIIPSFETEIDIETESSPPMQRSDVSTTRSPLALKIISPPRRRRLEDDYFDNTCASPSIIDFNSCSFPYASTQPNSEDRKLRSEQLAQRRLALWESQDLQSLSSYDSGIESMLWDSSSNNAHVCRDDIKGGKDNDLDNPLDVESFSTFGYTKSTDRSTDKSDEKRSVTVTSCTSLDYVKTLEYTVKKLTKELKEKDDIINKLKLSLDQREDNNSKEDYKSEDAVSSNRNLRFILCCSYFFLNVNKFILSLRQSEYRVS
jgi:hypothetical protein